MSNRSTVTREYILKIGDERREELYQRYAMYVKGVDESGADVKYQTAAQGRTIALRDIQLLNAVLEMAYMLPAGYIVSEESALGIEKLCKPNEKHRRTKVRL